MQSQRGNILFLILLAVVLFAALNYAVIGGERGQVKSISDEKAASYAATLMQYAVNVENTMNRMVTTGDIPILTLDWLYSGSSVSTVGANTNCLNVKCKVFNPGGGGLIPLPAPYEATDQAATGAKTAAGEGTFHVYFASVQDVGTTAPDVVMYLRSIKPEICDKINIAEGIYQKGAAMINNPVSSSDYLAFSGNLTSWPVLTANIYGAGDARIKAVAVFAATLAVP